MLAVLRERRRRSTPKKQQKSRAPRWDNLRYLAGTLVLLMHMMGELFDREGLRWLYVATWALRVPLFAMIAGYFSRADVLSPRELRRLIESVLVPYLVIGLLHTAQIRYFRDDWVFHTVNPAWGLWFLLSLLFWRAGLPYLAQLRYPLATSVVAALVAGYIGDLGPTMSLSRTLTFLPFFLLGWKLRQGFLAEAFRASWSRYAAIGVLATTAAVSWFIKEDVKMGWLRMNNPYGDGHPLDAPWAWTTRALVLLCGALVALSAIRLMTNRQIPVITYLGAGGMYIYLLHPLVLRPLFAKWDFNWVGPWHEQVLLVAMAFALASLLASPPVRWLTRPLVQPRLNWLFRPERPRSASAADAPADGSGRTPSPRPADGQRDGATDRAADGTADGPADGTTRPAGEELAGARRGPGEGGAESPLLTQRR